MTPLSLLCCFECLLCLSLGTPSFTVLTCHRGRITHITHSVHHTFTLCRSTFNFILSLHVVHHALLTAVTLLLVAHCTRLLPLCEWCRLNPVTLVCAALQQMETVSQQIWRCLDCLHVWRCVFTCSDCWHGFPILSASELISLSAYRCAGRAHQVSSSKCEGGWKGITAMCVCAEGRP